MTFESAVRRKARELGFDTVGIARADEPLDADYARYEAFVDAGMHGSMGYLAEAREARRRLDTDQILEGAKSVICVGRRYARAGDGEDASFARSIARYARGQDYHNHLRKRVRRLSAFVKTLAPDVRARPLIDVEPVLERAWASRAGLGFVGKNGLVITPGQGSYVLLGEVVTTLELVPDTPITERCGSCTRCLDACPTSAFAAPFVLDARRCISYLTIESDEAPPEAMRAAIGEHLFGCDDCQDVCPFNKTAPPNAERTRQFQPHLRWSETSLTDLVSLDEARFTVLVEGSPLQRARRAGLARNALIVAGNRAREGRAGEDEASAIQAGLSHEDAMVRNVAQWADAIHNRREEDA
jgi:epoxyqueuosine reductase